MGVDPELAYHKFERHFVPFLSLFSAVYNAASKSLGHDECIECDTDPMMRISQGSSKTDSLETQDEKRR